MSGAYLDESEYGPGNEDYEYDKRRQEQVDDEADAAETLRAHEDALKRQQPPVPQPCHGCTTKYAGAVCPTCKAERPAYTALKAMTAKPVLPAPLPDCLHFPQSLCGCEGRGLCLEAA